ncbi:hypothetical protein BK796_18370 [Kosakonia pseudosacchari]|uniref:Uncharacterized protein n=1 Tax=Kosakonia pseudosacchari TaxID=1646340 RepID=A0ABX4IL43_9ENTR|nr:hypothetical protein BK796_18370 [Kosakonia pseudosacchari]
METVVTLFPSYPTFLWITWCKILFIVSDQIWKTRHVVAQRIKILQKLSYKSSNCSYPAEKGTLPGYGAKLAVTF